MALGLRIFNNLPLGNATVTDPYVILTGDGTTTFYLGAGNGAYVGNDVLINSVVVEKGFGFTVSGDYITFTTAPANGATIVIPGIGYVPLSCTDTTGTNVATTMVYLADYDQIYQYTYGPTPPNSTILLAPYNFTSGSGSQTSWFQLSLADGNNNPIGYTAAGGTLAVPSITAQDKLQAANSGANITVATGSNFSSGYLLLMNPGAPNAEIVTVVSVASNTLTTTGFNFTHAANEPVYHCGFPVLVKATVPNNAAGHVPTALMNCGLRRTYRASFRF